MCGIYGILTQRSAPADEVVPQAAARGDQAATARALAAMHHRGPDDSGQATLVGAASEATFAFARLAILDLSPSGHQPMLSRDGRYALVFNGEVYNYRALRAELAQAGVEVRSTGDTEVVLHALVHWGRRALERFVGMFALGFYDRAADTLLLARDRLGKKPLYLTRSTGASAPRFGFASEVRTLLAAGLAAPRLDPDALGDYLASGSVQDPQTLVRGVTQLPPASWLEARITPSGALETTTGAYWRLPDPLAVPLHADWRDELAALLDEAVTMRLASDVPLGIFLSGGIDSAAILAVAARSATTRLEAFTLTFDEKAWDEGDRAAKTAATYGVSHLRAHLTAPEACDLTEPALGQQDQPSHDGLNTWFVSRAARQAGLVVALAGTGGDEVFGGYPYFARVQGWLALGRAGRVLPRALRERLLARMDARVPTRLRKAIGLALTGGDAAQLHTLVREHYAPMQCAGLITPHARGQAADAAMITGTSSGNLPDEARDIASWVTRRELETYVRNTQLRDIDQMSMANSLEVRAPLLDHRLVELLLSVPWSAKAPRAGVNKPLLIDAAKLDPAAFRAKKTGFVLPWEAWLRGPLRGLGDATLRDPAMASLGGALDPAAVAATWERFLAHRPRRLDMGGAVNASRILTLISLIHWCTKHRVALA